LHLRPIRTLDRGTSARYNFIIPPKTLAEPFLLQNPSKRVSLSVVVRRTLSISLFL
jgi:hypothetical protein